MRYEIRAMSFGEILDMGFRLLRDHFVLIVGLGATVNVPLEILQAWASGGLFAHAGVTGRIVAAVLAVAGFAIVAPVVGAAVTFALGEAYLERRPTMGDALRRAFAIILPLTRTMLLVWLAVLAPPALTVVLAGVVRFVSPRPALLTAPLVGVPLVILALVVMIYLFLGFLLVTQVVVLEQRFGRAALRRSRALMRDNLLRGTGIMLLAMIFAFVLGGLMQLALHYIPLVGPVASGLTEAVTTAYTSAVLVVLYFDIRCRKEAFDLEHLARLVAAGAEPIAPAAVASLG
jgi:uncharacterized protein (DUF697 family)